jgi:NAD(P)-dependent dehydrogenase (short-subunit alcohol dehydrogenase family)
LFAAAPRRRLPDHERQATEQQNRAHHRRGDEGGAAVVRIAARELAGRNVRVNAISPGPIVTPIFGKLGMPEASLNEFLTNAVTHIASRDSSFITGTELAVDGGMARM